MAIFLIFIASVFVSLSNFSMRKSIDAGGTTKGFLVFQMAIALLIAILLNPVKTGNYAINPSVVFLGTLAGLILAAMLFCLGRALEKGPPGLTFSIINASTVMPGILMAVVFGAALGFPYTPWHAIGTLIVVGGLFWAGKGVGELQDKKRWALFCLSMFSLHVLLLILFQYRALLLKTPRPMEFISLFSPEEAKSQWFMPFMFLASFLIQALVFLRTEKRKPSSREALFGVMGGVGNGLCTYFMIWSTEVASPLENAVIFPIFSVVTIILSNIWGEKLYQERVNWRACQLSAFGLIVGTVNWKAAFAALGF